MMYIVLFSKIFTINVGIGTYFAYFGANKTPVEVIKEGAFRGTYFRDICPGISGKWYKNHGKNSIS